MSLLDRLVRMLFGKGRNVTVKQERLEGRIQAQREAEELERRVARIQARLRSLGSEREQNEGGHHAHG